MEIHEKYMLSPSFLFSRFLLVIILPISRTNKQTNKND